MANIKANEKTHRKSEKVKKLNHAKKAEVRTIVKKTRTTKNKKNLDEVYSKTDKLAKTGRIHKNKANRIKSRTAKAVNKK